MKYLRFVLLFLLATPIAIASFVVGGGIAAVYALRCMWTDAIE